MSSLYRILPKVDQILEETYIEKLIDENTRSLVVDAIRVSLDELRALIANGIDEEGLKGEIDLMQERIANALERRNQHNLVKVINASGVVLHTNLGRAPLTKEIMENISKVACGYSNLEYDLEAGERGERYSHIEKLIAEITGAESAMLVNNNASAVMLILSTLAEGHEVITSRGELIEIGGAFRIPDVCNHSGARLIEVGTTNKTHLVDYENAITEDTAAILKVHTSNYRILGFTEDVSASEMLDLKKEHDIYIIEDLGSGVLIDLSKYGMEYEPTVQDSIKNGVDVVSFSGDKLLGGPQAGIIVGKKAIIDKLKKNHMTRALRVDKFTISALETVLRYYQDEELAIEKIPVLNMLTAQVEKLEKKANDLYDTLKDIEGFEISIVKTESEVGGGSLPLEKLPSYGVSISSDELNEGKIEEKLRAWNIPIIARVYNESVVLDVRTIFEEEFSEIKKALVNMRWFNEKCNYWNSGTHRPW